jgi:hypothetical protein
MTKVKLNIYTVLVCTLLVTGCDTLKSDSEAGLLEIHLQERFKNNHVRIELNGDVIFDDEITSNRAGLAGILIFQEEASSDPAGVVQAVPKQISKGEHDLHVWVDDSITAGTKFTLTDTSFIGIRYDMDFDNEVEILLSEKRFTYQ